MHKKNRNIVLFSSKKFFSFIKDKLPDYSITHYDCFKNYFKENAKRRVSKSFTLDSFSDITEYYDLNDNPDNLFWIVETLPHYVYSIKVTIIALRWMGISKPLFVSSFRNLEGLASQKPYNLKGLFDIKNKSEIFIRLPFNLDILSKLDKETIVSIEPKSLQYVISNYSLLDHELKKKPYSR